MRFSSHLPACLWLLAASLPAAAQQAPGQAEDPAQQDGALQRNPEANQLELANRLYLQAKDTKPEIERRRALGRVIPYFERFQKNFPNSKNREFVNYRLGYCYLVSGQVIEAEQCFISVVRNETDKSIKAVAAHRMGTLLFGRERYDDAAGYYQITANNAPQDSVRTDALYRIGRCYLKTGKRAQAISAFQAVLKDDSPNNQFKDAARLYLANLLLREEKYEEALAQFDLLTGKGKTAEVRGEASLQAGRIATQLGKLEAANDYFVTVLTDADLAKWRGEAQLSMMGNFYEMKKWEAVVKIYNSHQIVLPVSQDARRMLLYAKALFELKSYAQAGLAFSKVERLIPLTVQSFQANYYRLVCGYQQRLASLPDQVDSFVQVYQPRHPDSPLLDRALLLKAETLYTARRFKEAADTYRQLDPKQLPESQRADVLYRSGWVFTEVGDFAAAQSSFDLFLDRYPKHKDRGQALVKRAFCRIKRGDEGGGLADFAKVIETSPKSDLAAFALQQSALIYGRRGDDKRMVEHFGRLITDFPKLQPAALAEAHFWMGRGLFDQDKHREALEHLSEARQIVPEKYKGRAGTLIVLCNYSLADVAGLREAVDRLLVDAPKQKVAPTVLSWLGLQCAKVGDFKATNRYLTLASNPTEPKTTKKLVWKNLSKARLELGFYQLALDANDNYLAEERQEFFIAEGNLERARILLGLERTEDARKAVEKALEFNPQGALLANLRMALGDIEFAEKNYDKAASHFVVVAELFVNDDRLKPEAKYKAAEALEKAGKVDEAKKIRAELKKQFPRWKP